MNEGLSLFDDVDFTYWVLKGLLIPCLSGPLPIILKAAFLVLFSVWKLCVNTEYVRMIYQTDCMHLMSPRLRCA